MSTDCHEYIKDVFTNKKEYFYYRDLRHIIGTISASYNKNNYDFLTLKFLNIYGKLVERCKQQRYHKDDWEKYGRYDVMVAMRDDEEFQTTWKSLKQLLLHRIESCHKYTNPAEQVMTEEEILLILFEIPGLISRCAKPGYLLQRTVCEKQPNLIKFIDEPNPDVVDYIVDRDVKNVFLVKPQHRTLRAEIMALNAGVLKLNQINKKRLIEHDYNNDGYWHDELLVHMLQTVESQRGCLTDTQLEIFRLNAAGWEDNFGKIRSLKHMHNPSKAVKEKAVCKYPECVADIRFQYPAIQELALFSAFEHMGYYDVIDITLDYVYKKLTNVMPEVTQVYKDLTELYNNFSNVNKLKYQNEHVHMGCLHLAYRKDIDVRKVFALFVKPSNHVINYRDWYMSQQKRLFTR